MSVCRICPRRCGTDRSLRLGFCGADDKIRIGRASLHMWEEPVIGGKRGAGAIFFAGCPLRCVYCQNYALSRAEEGVPIEKGRLADIIAELEAQGAESIEFVTGSHYIPQIADALRRYKPGVPTVFNCGGYEREESLALLDGLIDVWMPDFKYSDKAAAARYSSAPDYPEIAARAVAFMKKLSGKTTVKDGILVKGLLVRHLVLPSNVANSRGVLDILSEITDEDDWLSLMSQYVPYGEAADYPEINRKLLPLEYKAVVSYAEKLGFKNVFIQEEGSADGAYIPRFDGSGA